jgi:hypothetical protein
MTERVERARRRDGTVSGDVRIAEADTGEKLPQGRVAPPETGLHIETAASLVDDSRAEHMRVRERECVILTIVLGEAQSDEWRYHQRICLYVVLRVVHHVEPVAIREVMINANRAQMTPELAGH